MLQKFFMKISFSYNKKQVIQALRYHFISRPEIKLLIIFVNVFAILSAALFFFHKVSPLAFLISSLLWTGLMAAFWFFLPNTVYKRASTFKEKFMMSFGEHQVSLETERGYTNWDWNKFSTYIETPHFIHLYFDSRSFFLVPKEAVESVGKLDELRELLRLKIPKS
jgi:hypothetical protein